MNAVEFQQKAMDALPLMHRVALSYLKNAADAEDAVQDALLKAWEKRHTLGDPERFQAWLARIVSNRCRDLLRRKKLFSFFPLREDSAQYEMPDPASPVKEAMEKLKPDKRLLMTLHYADGYSVEEISRMLGLPSGTVKTRMRAARKQLERILNVEWGQSL